MNVCEDCFNSDVISEHIKKQGRRLSQPIQCSICENDSLFRYENYVLRSELQAIIKRFYEHEWEHGLVASASMMARQEGDDISLYLPGLKTLKEVCYELFEIDCDDKFYKFLHGYETNGESEFHQDPDEKTWLNMGCKWEGSDDIRLSWSEFCNNVKYKARFFDHTEYSRTEELSKLKKTFETLLVYESIILYRARKIESEEILEKIKAYPENELGKAPERDAGLNRFSPNGIAYVYLSTEKETAIKEIRLNQGELYAIGMFQIDNLRLVDLRYATLGSIKKDPFSDKFTSELICSAKYIQEFIRDISKPIKDKDKYLDYIPTQIVSEYIWSLGYDGFIFDSSLCHGNNYVLFDKNYRYLSYKISTY